MTTLQGPSKLPSNRKNDEEHKVKFCPREESVYSFSEDECNSSDINLDLKLERRNSVSCKKSIYVASDSDDSDQEAEKFEVREGKNSIGLVYESVDNFSSFEDLMKVDKIKTKNFFRKPFKIPAEKINLFPIPWPSNLQKLKNVFSRTNNVYYKLDGLIFSWTPLLTHEKTTVTIAITDSRGSTGKPVVINHVKFETNNITMSGMSIGYCVHEDDLKKIQLSVALESKIAGRGVTYASLEAIFHISVTNRASLETHSVINPLVIPPEVKNLLKDYKQISEYLRKSNAKIVSKLKKDEDRNDLEEEMNGKKKAIGPSVAKEQVVAMTKRMSKLPTTEFGLSGSSFET